MTAERFALMKEQKEKVEGFGWSKSLIMIVLPIFSMVVNFLGMIYLDLSIAVIYLILGLLISILALVLGIIGLFMSPKVKNYFLIIIIVLFILSMIPLVFFVSAFLSIGKGLPIRDLSSQQLEVNYIWVADQLTSELQGYKIVYGEPPDSLEDYFARIDSYAEDFLIRTPRSDGLYKPEYLERIHYMISSDKQDFLVYVDLESPESGLSSEYSIVLAEVVNEPTMGIDCANEMILCLK